MGSIRYFLAILLLFFSEQSLALFLPGGVAQVTTDNADVTIDAGC
jgi:hypothetical protein